jgi:hypothetical protein
MIDAQESEEEEESGKLFHVSEDMGAKVEVKPDHAVPDGMGLMGEKRVAAIEKRLNDHTVK